MINNDISNKKMDATIKAGDVAHIQLDNEIINVKIKVVKEKELRTDRFILLFSDQKQKWQIMDLEKNHEIIIISKLNPEKLLTLPRSTNKNNSFMYYKKEIPVPNIGDIIIVNVANFSSYYILVWSVKLNSGKKGTIYTGWDLGQKGIEIGMSPSSLKSRDDFLLNGKYYQFMPKDRSNIIDIKITQF